MAKTFNPFDAFAVTERKVVIEALDNYEVTLKDLTIAEADGYNKRLLKDYTGKGDPVIDLEEATKINYEKVAKALIDPKMTVAQLQALGTQGSKAITEIVKAIDGKDDFVDSETGNLSDSQVEKANIIN